MDNDRDNKQNIGKGEIIMGINYKYELLMSYFKGLSKNKLRLTYIEIEKIIKFKLPDSAYNYRAYWNESKTHTITRSWIENGWKITEVNLGYYIEFERINTSNDNY